MIINVHWSSCKVPVSLVIFQLKLIFSKDFRTTNFMKIRPVGAELFHADGRTGTGTDMTELIVVFGDSAAPINRSVNAA